ncbi:hypothetical protein [uncultured Maribacter sp.]|uniref:hypothetical protein n=1 Tax=uncultured Maribacter sp. TaxID=431308 RepID=UPI0030DAC8DC|tara:strand:- start:2722 stop:3804 length:1083 start_codon:yes stop_codon:yes gene_type:complete
MKKNVFTRKDLYDLVWSKSISAIANDFQIKPQRVKEICKENEIPLPDRGYWSKIRFKKKVVKTPLPMIEHDNLLIDLNIRKFRTDYHKRAFELAQRQDLNFKVPRKISTYHPLVKSSKNLLEIIDESKNKLRFWEVAQKHDILPIHTNTKLRARALRLMDTLIKVIEAMDCNITFYCNRAHVEMFGQKTEINLRQKVHRIRTTDKRGWTSESWEESDKLEFQTGPSFDRKNWIDNTKRTIEACLPEIIAWIEKDCRYWHDLRAEQAIEENKKALQAQKLEAIKAQQEEEQAKVNQLFSDAENWSKAELAERYLNEMEKKAIDGNQSNPDIKDYIMWARKIVSELNPLNKASKKQLINPYN